jgi:hypothetical protein
LTLIKVDYTDKMKVRLVLLLVALLQSFNCYLGVDVSQLFPTSAYQCLKSNGYGFTIVRAYCSFGGVDHNAVQSLTNAKAAGMITDVYLFPCRSKNPATQVDEMMAAVPANLYGMVWIDVETNESPGCSWAGHDSNSNCQFLADLIARIKSHGKNLGIYATAYMWQSIFGSRNACPSVASQQLWYAHYDGSASFSDFSAFGGWTKPTIKQFQGTNSLCGASIDKNYYP